MTHVRDGIEKHPDHWMAMWPQTLSSCSGDGGEGGRSSGWVKDVASELVRNEMACISEGRDA